MRFRRIRESVQSDEQQAHSAMKAGLVDVVARLLGEPPAHIYDYGMQPAWKLRAYQWLADQKRPPAIYPVHCWSAGYGGPQSPMTWFACTTCDARELGTPAALPERGCFRCLFDGRDFQGWEVADESSAFTATIDATKGMSEHSTAKVFRGP